MIVARQDDRLIIKLRDIAREFDAIHQKDRYSGFTIDH